MEKEKKEEISWLKEPIMRKLFSYLVILSFIIFQSCGSTTEKPNIIVLLVDDAGYADFGFMGCKDLKTPNIDKLAKSGVIFKDAHVAASVCGPSRAGLMTGRYQQRFGYECNGVEGKGVDTTEVTIADALKSGGYATAAIGKWHLGELEAMKPNKRGFDYFWGFLNGGRSYFYNEKGNDKPGSISCIRENDTQVKFEGYLTDVLADKAVEFIDKNKKNPFFIYWAPNAVHTPMHATKEDLGLFKDHPRQKLAAMTWALDRAVGKILKKLDDEKILDNTIIFFLSDNGGAHNNQSVNLPLKGFKGNKYEGGHRVAYTLSWPAKFKGNRVFHGLSSAYDIFATAIDAAGIEPQKDKLLDGVSLIPYMTGEKKGNPHDKLFWRKDKMAAYRKGSYKMIRVERLGCRLYQLEDDLGESNDLSVTDSVKLNEMRKDMQQWEKSLIDPLWTEGAVWDTITWMIHEDFYRNMEPRVKNPGQLKKIKKKQMASSP